MGNILIAQTSQVFDIVLVGGRVLDPETKLDGIRNIGILGNRIAEVSTEPLQGKEMVSVAGLVVAPGFIDLHVHGVSNVEQQYQMRDGVTTALELEWGIPNLKEWYASRQSKALINYGASVCWPYERFKVFNQDENLLRELRDITRSGETTISTLTARTRHTYAMAIEGNQATAVMANIKTSLEEGGVGIGVPIGYLPNTNPDEMYQVFKFAGQNNTLVYTHVRESDIASIQEVIANATLTNAPLHIVHINSMALGNIKTALDMVSTAQQRKFDITTELYSYTAASTAIESALFDEGWQKKRGITYSDLQWVETGERLNKETFDAYRKKGGMVIIHMMKPEWISAGLAAPGVIVASDGMPYSRLAHPRTAGTFSRVLGRYVREEKLIDLMTAIEKMTLLPARRLEAMAPVMRFKGRIQVGADADITIFNPNTIIDNATFDKGLAYSSGIEYVLVNGTFVVKKGNPVPGALPGQPVFGRFKK